MKKIIDLTEIWTLPSKRNVLFLQHIITLSSLQNYYLKQSLTIQSTFTQPKTIFMSPWCFYVILAISFKSTRTSDVFVSFASSASSLAVDNRSENQSEIDFRQIKIRQRRREKTMQKKTVCLSGHGPRTMADGAFSKRSGNFNWFLMVEKMDPGQCECFWSFCLSRFVGFVCRLMSRVH